ncbi:type IV pili methyl-accepting chemotaxis transducer N-terminal domain-containing protein [Desulforamulus aeronauticus]|uniref:Type IV pili methyl-accepting chemotaxis transducer N-term n=1 Tax=Desulforamulus aeronauticus DSM 10349 TaxID=1121421 RepID=A0A1M6NZ64_9FIRM|nr:type IV pili methyl-accepting chemotaxis transducer N-terminal domain-containing protein [Desulforamulus aeronauticus]SHK00944.1 Type IV pili methyl-accepting chemotaxis transducer N-term [Desulforamulus aeronauticus DSM 10349]
MKNLSLKWKVLIPLILVLATTVLQINLIIAMNRAQQEDAVRVNVAGRQRMLSQRMAKDVFGFVLSANSQHQEDLKKAMDIFEESLGALKTGGSLEVGGTKVEVTKTKNTEIVKLLVEAETNWQGIKSDIQGISSITADAIDQAEAVNVKLVKMVTTFDQATKMYETASAVTVKENMTVIYACAVGYLLLILFSWQITNRYIIKPVTVLQKAAEDIAKGDLSLNDKH